MMGDVRELEEKLGYGFHDKDILTAALTHSSYAKEKGGGVRYNERLEFLGDAFFDAIVGEEFFRLFPEKKEGSLSRLRAIIVCESSLANKARQIGLGKEILLGRGEEKTGGRNRTSILADAMEAIIGAIYLDGGFEVTKKAVLDLFRKEIDEAACGRAPDTDHKTRLQEKLQAEGVVQISYEVLDETGPDHDKTFVAGLYVDGVLQSKGKGKSKKEAQQNAAKAKLEREN